jgi:hypothetical protein
MFQIRKALVVLSLAALGVVAQADTIVVHPGNLNGWGFAAENTNSGQNGGFRVGPGMPPAGSGSAFLNLTNTNQGMILGTYNHAGTRLADITQLTYSTFRSSPGAGAQAPSLQFNVDFDGSDTWQGRLVFEPYQTPGNTVVTGVWQEWDALAGNWWATRAPYSTQFSQSNPVSWNDILAAYPNARIRVSDGPILFKVGSGWLFEGSVDNFTIGVSGNNTTYDFEAGDSRPSVDTGSGDTGVPNVFLPGDNAYIQDLVNAAQLNARNHGQYVSAITHLANRLSKAGIITNQQAAALKNGAARSDIGK